MKERKHQYQGSGKEKSPYMYPIQPSEIDGAKKLGEMTEDQWIPFSLCMRQSRLRYEAERKQEQCKQMTMVINGEGGSGKSWLIRHIVKDLHNVFGDNNLSVRKSKRVLLMAHHGSAAFKIKGSTVCSSLSLPSRVKGGFSMKYVPLISQKNGTSKLKALQDRYRDTHLVIIIDEYSVISCGMLHWIDQTFREIFPQFADIPFGGRDIIIAGDAGQRRDFIS